MKAKFRQFLSDRKNENDPAFEKHTVRITCLNDFSVDRVFVEALPL